jgi:hypothetical protein
VRLDRVEALFEICRALDGVTAPEARALAAAVVEALRRDRERFSDVFEPSISVDEAGEHALRFSYAFPGFREAPATAVHAALAMAAPFGPALTAATRRLLRAATDPAVEQPLVGIAWDRAGAPRHKVYLQLRDGAGRAAADLAGRVLGLPWLAESLAGAAPLHMLGVDLGRDGLTGAKLYLAHAVVPPGDAPIAQALATLAPGPRPYRRVLEIRRLTAASREERALPPASDVDLGLADNDLLWEDVAKVPTLAPTLGRSRAIHAVFSSFQVEVRRLSLSVSAARRTTVYYALREVEA